MLSVLKTIDTELEDLKSRTAGVAAQDLKPEVSKRIKYLEQTRRIVNDVGMDAYKQAGETVKRFEKWVKDTPYLSKDTAREQAKKKFGLTGAPREVDEIIEKLKNY